METSLARFLVKSVLTAPRAILLHLETLGIVALVLRDSVIATLALGACKSNQCTHESS